MIVAKRVSFDAAHFLPNYVGKCHGLHGHHWIVEVAIEGEVDPKTGMVVDFIFLKDAVNSVIGGFDHSLLNDTLINPTAENIAQYIYDRFRVEYFNIKLAWVKVWETEDSYVMLEAE